MEDTKNSSVNEDQNVDDPDKTDDEQDQSEVALEENDEQAEVEGDHEEEDATLLDQEADEEHPNDSTLLDETGDLADASEKKTDADDADESAATKDKIKSEAEDEHEVDEAEIEEDKKRDVNEMPQVNVANLAKRKWQVKVYPLKPEDFANGQISRVFNNARESLLYIISAGKFSGGKGEMYVSSGAQAARVVHNLMKLDFKSQNINIEIIRKNDQGAIEEKAVLRFDAKLVRILCVPAFSNRRPGIKRDRYIGSVFVKNLPKNTSKDMLRAMFPFVQEINFNPDKYADCTARLVLSTRNAVAPCLKAFIKLDLGETSLELCHLNKKKTTEEKSEAEKTKKDDGKKDAKSESDSKKDDKGSPKDKEQSKTKSPATSKSSDAKKDKKSEDTKSKTSSSQNRTSRVLGVNRRIGDRRDGAFRVVRNRLQGNRLMMRGNDSRNRFRTGGFGMRNRSDERRIRPVLPGASGDGRINTSETTKEMIILQSQLSMAIKNQLSMLNQTQMAIESAKMGTVGLGMSREPQPAPTALMSTRLSDQYSFDRLDSEQNRRTPANKGGNRRYQQARRGNNRSPREEKRQVEDHLASLAGTDFGYKRNAGLAGLQQDYSTSGLGKRRNIGMTSRGWNDESDSYGQTRFGYDYDQNDREAEFHRMQGGNMGHSSGSYGHSSYSSYRY